MIRNAGLCFAALLLTITAAPLWAGVKTSEVTIKSGDEEIKGFLAVPEGKGPFPAIVVIQEWWGLNDWIKENAKHFASLGYVALAPDLYRGKVTDDPTVAIQLLKGLPRDRAVRDLTSSVDFLAGRDEVKKDQFGSIGWCMGGGYSLQLALADKRLAACVMCYGPVVTESAKLKTFNATLLGIYGEEDKGIKASSVREFEEQLKKAGKKVESVQIYKGAGHGFMRAANGPTKKNPAYNEEAATDAWKRIDAFFAKTLSSK